MFLGKTYQEFAPALLADSIVVVRGRVSAREDGMNLHAVTMFTPDLGQSLGAGPLVISVPELRATTDVVTVLNDVLIRHSGDTEVRLKLIKGPAADDLTEVELGPGDVWRNLPGEVHTIEAIEDTDVLEVSTPELDDVVRLSDRYGREGTTAH